MEFTSFHSPLLVFGFLFVYFPCVVCSISPQSPASNINPIDKQQQPKLGSGHNVTTTQETTDMPTTTFSEPSTSKDDGVPMDIVQGSTAASPENTTETVQITSIATEDSTPISSETTIPKAETSNITTASPVSSSMSSSVTASSDSTDKNGTSQVTSEQSTQSKTTFVTSGVSTPETTSKSNGDVGKGDKNTGICKSGESMFGKYGMEAFIGAFGLCIILMVILIILIFKYTQKSNNQRPDDEKNVPKLKLLELRKTETRTGGDQAQTDETRDGLQTYSLDYEKHVQEKIDEHKRKTRAPSDTNAAAVSSFMVGKKPSLIATRSLQSPTSPTSPGSQKPLLSDDDEPVVFNFTKIPGESLQAGNRRTSNLEPGERRKSNASTGKAKKAPDQSKEYFTANI